ASFIISWPVESYVKNGSVCQENRIPRHNPLLRKIVWTLSLNRARCPDDCQFALIVKPPEIAIVQYPALALAGKLLYRSPHVLRFCWKRPVVAAQQAAPVEERAGVSK